MLNYHKFGMRPALRRTDKKFRRHYLLTVYCIGFFLKYLRKWKQANIRENSTHTMTCCGTFTWTAD